MTRLLDTLITILGLPGLILVAVGGVVQRHAVVQDTHVLAAIFLTVFGTVGGLLECAAWLHWQIFY